MATVKGFKINGIEFRITGQSHGDSHQYILLEEWTCEKGPLVLHREAEDLFRMDSRWGAGNEMERLLGTLGFLSAGRVTEEQLESVFRRVFSGVTPRPPLAEEVTAEYRKCYSYRLEFVRKHIVVELESFVYGGGWPPIGLPIVGQVTIPYAYAFVMTAAPDCCDNREKMQREIINSWNALKPPDEVDVGEREPMRSVLRKAKEQIDAGEAPPLRSPGVEFPLGLGWGGMDDPPPLEDGAPEFRIGGG